MAAKFYRENIATIDGRLRLKKEYGINDRMIDEALQIVQPSAHSLRRAITNLAHVNGCVEEIDTGRGVAQFVFARGEFRITLNVDVGTQLPGFDYWCDMVHCGFAMASAFLTASYNHEAPAQGC